MLNLGQHLMDFKTCETLKQGQGDNSKKFQIGLVSFENFSAAFNDIHRRLQIKNGK